MNIYQKLVEIQKSVDSFSKDKKAFNYSYTTGDQVLSKIRPLMNEQGLLLVQEINDAVNERIDYVNSKGVDKSEILTSAKMTFVWIDSETGEDLRVPFFANGMNDWDKGLGSALTYAERYFLLKFFHIPTDADDVDARQGGGGKAKSPNKAKSPSSTPKSKSPSTKKTPPKMESVPKPEPEVQEEEGGISIVDEYLGEARNAETRMDAINVYKKAVNEVGDEAKARRMEFNEIFESFG